MSAIKKLYRRSYIMWAIVTHVFCYSPRMQLVMHLVASVCLYVSVSVRLCVSVLSVF